MPFLHHHPFWIPPKTNFPNNDFADSTVTIISGDIIEITGWVFYLRQIKMNGNSVIDNCPTPADTYKAANATIDSVSKRSSTDPNWSFRYAFSSTVLPPGFASPTKSVRLYSTDCWINRPYGILRGPYMVSKVSVRIVAGSVVKFWYKGQGSEDAFDIYGYLLNTDNCSTVTLVDRFGTDSTGATNWTEVSVTVPITGNYKFVFINGSWDFTGGQLTGASMYICKVTVEKV
jgi:hypothetical protein